MESFFDPTHKPWRRDLALDVILRAAEANLGGRVMVRDLDRAAAMSGGSWMQVNALRQSIGL